MSDLSLTKLRFQQGVWHGLVTTPHAGEEPVINVSHAGTAVQDVRVLPGPTDTEWQVQVPIPKEAIADGMQTLLVSDKVTDTVLGQITLMAGEDLGDDMRAEMSLLREELDMLKRAFRRHCVETA